MKLSALLSNDQIILKMSAKGHRDAIRELVEHLDLADLLQGEDREEVIQSLWAREDQTSTGIGSGVAIPHCFSDKIKRVICVFGRSEEGIEFEALDHAPVKFIVLFIVPKADYYRHLQTLAAIAKLFTNCEVRKALSEAENKHDILRIFASKPSRIDIEQ